ncbi:MAG: DUF1214 domain-containing protein [Pseudomonadales bacterium]
MKLSIFFLALVVVVGGGTYYSVFHNPQNAEQQQMNEAWAQFAQEIEALGELVENAPFNTDERTAAEGYRHLVRYLSSFMAKQTDHNNPDYPQFTRFPNSVARIGWDNPDNPYLSASVRGDHTYRIRGNIANFDLITFNVYSGMLGYTPMAEMRTISSITTEDLVVDQDGDFELILSAEKQAGNWLKLEPDADNVVIRRLVSDWQQTEEGSWEILNLTTLGQSAPRADSDDIATQLKESVEMARGVREALTMAHRMLFQLKQKANEVPVPRLGDPALPMSDPFQATSRAYFKLADDEALLIEVPQAACKFTNIQLANPWMESLDYASRQSSLNNHMTHVNSDGMIRYVISKQDPAVANWLDTAGYPEGSLFARWNSCESYPVELSSIVVKLSDLPTHLPADTPTVTTAQRTEILAGRQSAISRRYAGG